MYRTLPENGQLPYALYTAEQVRRLDRLAIEQFDLPGEILMERAGKSTFDLIQVHWPDLQHLLVFCGTGNNGGDGC